MIDKIESEECKEAKLLKECQGVIAMLVFELAKGEKVDVIGNNNQAVIDSKKLMHAIEDRLKYINSNQWLFRENHSL